tara:strand:+ start:1893 stop:4103 length:2211 start_codon:yes stop_codon:yes gene_type:complete
MAYKKDSKTPDIVNDTLRVFKDYSKKRDSWAQQAKEDKEFRLGRQWTKEQSDILEARGQAPIVVNRIHPAVETAKAMLTANRPSFRCAPREDSDRKVANVFSALLSYMYDISDGRTIIRQAIDDYYVMGVGYINIYQDPKKDMGKGEVCMHNIDPLDVYVDPNSRDRFFDDAENIIVSRLFSRDQAKKIYPQYKKEIDNAESEQDFNMPETGRDNDSKVFFPEDIGLLHEQSEYVRGYERYSKIDVKKIRTYESFSGKEELLDEKEFDMYIQQPAWIIQGQVITDEAQAQQIAAQLMEQYKLQEEEARLMMEQDMQAQGAPLEADSPSTGIQPPQIEQVTYEDLILQQAIKVVKIMVTRIKQCIIMGETLLYSRIMPIEHYPIVPMCNLHTRTPYPTSDVRMVKGLQEYINKTRSLIIAHATTSTNTKILVPEGSVDMKDFEEKWAQPGVAIPYDPTDGAPVTVQPSPLPNELYSNEQTAKNDIDHQLGLYEMMMGNSSAAPQTYKATISLDEFGQRKIKSKLTDIEQALVRAGQVAIPLMQQLYSTEKTFRLVNPNNSMSEYVVNKRLYDDKTGEIQVINDITIGMYDVMVVSGSTLPTNRFAELEFYMDAYQKGLVDRQEVLKKTEIFDIEGVMQRTDEIQKLTNMLKQQEEQIKQLKGDLQTRDRESVGLRKKVELEKFKGQLDQVSNKSKAAGTLFERRLDDNLATVKRQISDASKKEGSPSSGKEAAKNRK